MPAAVAHRPTRPRSPRARRAALALATVLALGSAGPVGAADVEWLFRGSGFWDDGANWLEGTPPGLQDDVRIDLGSGNLPAVIRQRPGEAAISIYRVRSLAAAWPVQLLGGVITASGDMSFAAGLDWRGGAIGLSPLETTGTARFAQGFQITAARVLGLNVSRAELTGASLIDTRGAAPGADAGLVVNVANGFELAEGASLTLMGDTPRLMVAGRIDLRGTLTRTDGSGAAELWFRDGSAIAGAVRVNTGTLSLLYGGSNGEATHSGRFSVDAGSTLRISPGQVFTGRLEGAGTVQLALVGNTQVRSDSLRLSGTLALDPGAQLNLTGPGEAMVATLRTSGGTLRPDDRLTVQQHVQSSSLLVIQGAADSVTTFAQGTDVAVGLSVFSGHLVLGGGTTLFSGGQFLGLVEGSTLRVAPGAVLQLDAGHFEGSPQGPVVGGGLLQVQGTLARSAAATGPGLVGAQIVNSGLIDLAGGQLTLQSAFTQTGDGTLRLRLTGDDDPRLVLQGAASFAGGLQLDLAEGFQLQAGQRVALLRWTGHSGLPSLDAGSAALAPGLRLALQADDQALWLQVASAPVPEPAAWALWLGGLAALGWRGARRRG